MARKGRDVEMVQVTLKLPRGLVNRLDEAADERVLGRNLLVEKLLEAGLGRLVPLAGLMAERRLPSLDDLFAPGTTVETPAENVGETPRWRQEGFAGDRHAAGPC